MISPSKGASLAPSMVFAPVDSARSNNAACAEVRDNRIEVDTQQQIVYAYENSTMVTLNGDLRFIFNSTIDLRAGGIAP